MIVTMITGKCRITPIDFEITRYHFIYQNKRFIVGTATKCHLKRSKRSRFGVAGQNVLESRTRGSGALEIVISGPDSEKLVWC